uniref:NPHS1 adhesion molecule, nephrin n=1 Tax=Gasterosteus aculeatus aculeatus TaxID=481459 RepID=G3NY17_GASAC
EGQDSNNLVESGCLLYGALFKQESQAFRSEPRNLTVRMGATAVLRCEVLRASGTVQWEKDGLLLGPQRSLPGFLHYSMIGNPKRGQYHLQIEKAKLEDEAFYTCQVGQSESSQAIVSSSAWVNVLIPPSKPYFEVDMKSPWVAGRKYVVACIAPDAKPEAEITLYKDGVELTGTESFTTSGSKDKLLNTHTKVTYVFTRLPDSVFSPTCSISPSLSLSFFPPQPPVILGLEREDVKAGRILVLECVSHGGNPLASLHWTKNGEVLSRTWEADVTTQKSRSVLKLKITPADNQAVVCCASENLSPSRLSVSHTITVLFEPAEVTLSGSSTAVEGQDLTLNCYATSSNPPVHIRWWLGYKELNTSVATMEEGDNGGMTTMSSMNHTVSREEDGLKITCEAFNKGTQFSKTQFTTLNVYCEYRIPLKRVWRETPPQDVPLRSRDTRPHHLVLNGKVVSNALKQTSFDRGAARELLLVLTASDNMATYRCDATNEAMQTISAHTQLKVNFTAVSMKISTDLEVLRRGQMLTLECQAGSSNPKANISWSLGGLRFGVEQPPRSAQFGGVSVHSTLSLNLSSQHHNHRVICQSYSPVLVEATNTFYKLNVLYPPEFSPEQPVHIQVQEDDMATIPLLVSANPEKLSCKWLNPRGKLVKGDPTLYKNGLEIENVTRRDAGVYRVNCTNDEGSNEISITLDVQYAPSVEAEKDPVVVNLGETADLICVADANPIVSDMFSWEWLGEEEVEMGEENQHDESGLLTIHNVTRAHAGLYQCTANNDIASPATVNIQLVVQFKPEVLKGAQWTKVASRGDGTSTAEMVCRAEGIPRVDFSWEKNGLRMDFANPRYEERAVKDGSFHTSTVRVVNVSASLDYTIFRCTARNSLGEDTLDIKLVSKNHPDPPSMFRQLAVSHDSVTLEWISGFDGGLFQGFRIRYRWDKSDSFLYMDVFPPGATFFTVTGLQPITTYNFSVNAHNAMGESGFADNNAVLTITTKDPDRLPAYLTAVGVLLFFNSLGIFFGVRWKKKSAQSTDSNSNKYESREKINAAAQRTLLIDSGSETDSHVYESYEISHRYYPTGDYNPPLSPLPEEMRRLGETQTSLRVNKAPRFQHMKQSHFSLLLFFQLGSFFSDLSHC